METSPENRDPREAPGPSPAAGAARLRDEAARLAAALRDEGERIERARTLPPDVAEALRDAGLFSLCVPRSLGGPEAHPELLIDVVATLAAADGSVGWCTAIAATSSVLAAYLEPEAAREIFASPLSVAGGVFAPLGRARAEAGGFRLSGRWSFASGCRHCTWLMGGCLIDGAHHLLLFPREAATIHDNWDVAGLLGTGSDDIEVRELFVPRARAVSLVAGPPREAGALYAFPVFGLLALGVASVGLGLARRAIDALVELAARKTPTLARRRLAERTATQAAVGLAEARLAAADAGLRRAVGAALEAAGTAPRGPCGPEAGGTPRTMPLAERARLRLAATHAVREAAACVDAMYELGGGSAIYKRSVLQRCLRDVHVLTQHAMVAAPTLETAGRVLLGLETDTSTL